MPLSLDSETVAKLKQVLDFCMKNPLLLYQPELSALKNFVEHFGGKIPDPEPTDSPSKKSETPKAEEPVPEPEAAPEPESEESDLELDMTGIIEPDTDEPVEMGDTTLEPTEEQIAASQTKRSEAVAAFVEKNYEKAIQLYTEAIILNPQTALLYAKRGQVFLLLNKPNACIRDCDRALELNPDSAAAHKFRGRAYHLLGKFEEAARDLRLACKFDFDEQADQWLTEVTPNARKIEEHKRKKERKLQEKLERERQEKLRKAKEQQAKAREESTQADSNASENFFQFINNPEVRQAFQDPELLAAVEDICKSPANILKYQNNPKIMGFLTKMSSKLPMGDKGAFPSGFPGGMPWGFPGAEGPQTDGPKPPKAQDDVGLD